MTERESVFHDGGGAAWQWHAWIGMGMGWQDAAQRGWVGLPPARPCNDGRARARASSDA